MPGPNVDPLSPTGEDANQNRAPQDQRVDMIPNGDVEVQNLTDKYARTIEELKNHLYASYRAIRSYETEYIRMLNSSVDSTDLRLRQINRANLELFERLQNPAMLFRARMQDAPPNEHVHHGPSPEQRAYYVKRASFVDHLEEQNRLYGKFFRDGDSLVKVIDNRALRSAGRQITHSQRGQDQYTEYYQDVERDLEALHAQLVGPDITIRRFAGNQPPPPPDA